jgi:Ca-activated chloride channel family protein
MIFVIDTSGSMGGASIQQAKSALQSGLGQLTGADRFNVIEFNNDAQSLYSAPVMATVQSVQAARGFVRSLGANGGTNMHAAITTALAQPVSFGYLRQIVFITDGSVGNESDLFRLIQRDLGDARLFTVGIGAAPNTHFMRKAAQFGRGSYSHIANPDEVEPGMRRLFDKLEHVALRDIQLSWPDAFEVYPERLPDLYRGEPVIVAARMPGPLIDKVSLTASGTVGPYGWSQQIDVAPGNSAGVASIWARRKIDSLLDRKLEGAAEAVIRAEVVDVALEHGILSPYTSLVAVDKTPDLTRNAELVREALGNMNPAGSEFATMLGVFPNTATDARWYRLLGGALSALVLSLFFIPRIRARPKQ